MRAYQMVSNLLILFSTDCREQSRTLTEITVGFIYPREGVKTMAKKKRLISGEKFYCRCPSCSETWDYPPVISYLDDENTLPITDRHTTCTATDPTQDMAYNFSIALSCRDEKTQDKYWQVIRGCSAHRNFHYHHYKYRSDRSVVEENRPLNSIMESNAAYEEATAFIVEGAFERIEEWQASK